MPKGSRGGSKESGGGNSKANPYSAEERGLLLGLPANEQKDLYIHTGGTTSSFVEDKKYHNDDTITSIKNEAKYDSVLINENLPTLEGTEKQVKYANDLRKKAARNALQRVDEASGGQIVDKTKRYETIERNIQAVNKQFGTKINNKSELVNFVMNNSPKLEKWQKIKKMTKARDVIDALT